MNIASSIVYSLIERKKRVTTSKYIIGLIFLTIIDSYIFLSFISVIILLSDACTTNGSFYKIILWGLAAILSIGTAITAYKQAKNKLNDSDVGKQEFIHVNALLYTVIICTIGYFLLAKFPEIISYGWPWVEAIINSLI
jgi:hypothetical protein